MMKSPLSGAVGLSASVLLLALCCTCSSAAATEKLFALALSEEYDGIGLLEYDPCTGKAGRAVFEAKGEFGGDLPKGGAVDARTRSVFFSLVGAVYRVQFDKKYENGALNVTKKFEDGVMVTAMALDEDGRRLFVWSLVRDAPVGSEVGYINVDTLEYRTVAKTNYYSAGLLSAPFAVDRVNKQLLFPVVKMIDGDTFSEPMLAKIDLAAKKLTVTAEPLKGCVPVAMAYEEKSKKVVAVCSVRDESPAAGFYFGYLDAASSSVSVVGDKILRELDGSAVVPQGSLALAANGRLHTALLSVVAPPLMVASLSTSDGSLSCPFVLCGEEGVTCPLSLFSLPI